MQQWGGAELQGLASTLRTHTVPLANSNLVSFDVSAVGGVAPSLTLTLSTDGEGATIKSGAMCVRLEHCVGHLNDLETHRTLLLFADEGPDRCGPLSQLSTNSSIVQFVGVQAGSGHFADRRRLAVLAALCHLRVEHKKRWVQWKYRPHDSS